jgi:hypothetical protein
MQQLVAYQVFPPELETLMDPKYTPSIQKLRLELANECKSVLFSPSMLAAQNHMQQTNIMTDLCDKYRNQFIAICGMNALADAYSKSGHLRSTGQLTEQIRKDAAEKYKDTLCHACQYPGPWRMCARCKAVHYCSTECQRQDWSIHKETCKTPDSPQHQKKQQ